MFGEEGVGVGTPGSAGKWSLRVVEVRVWISGLVLVEVVGAGVRLLALEVQERVSGRVQVQARVQPGPQVEGVQL